MLIFFSTKNESKIMKQRALFISLFLLVAIYVQADHFKYSFLYSSRMNEGLSQLSVTAMCQDSKGYLWLGTRNGLNRYNGSTYTIYSHQIEDSLSLVDNQISCLAEQDGRYLWIGTSRGVSRLSLTTDSIRNYYVKDGLAVGEILSVYVDRHQQIWVGTRTGLCRYLPGKDCFEIVPFIKKKSAISAIMEDRMGRFWIGTLTNGVVLCDNKMRLIKHFCVENNSLAGNAVSSLFEDSSHSIWVGSNPGGVNQIDTRTFVVTQYTSRNSGLDNDYVRCLAEWEGRLLVGTPDGIYAFTSSMKRFHKVGRNDGSDKMLEHYSIYSFCLDRMGTLWIGSLSGGVSRLSILSSRFVRHNPDDEKKVHTGVYEAVCYDRNGQLWIATEKSGLLNYDPVSGNSQFYFLPLSSIAQAQEIRTVYAENNYIWCGTTQGEIYRLDLKTKQFKLYYRFPVELAVYAILRDSTGNLWVGTSKGGCSLICFTSSGERIEHVVTKEGNSLTIPIRCLLEEKPGVLLMGTRGSGLLRLSIDSIDKTSQKKRIIGDLVYYNTTVADENHKIQSNYISAILRARNKELWVSTYGGGFYRINAKGRVDKKVTEQQGLMNNSICDMVEGANGTLWMSTAAGISKYSMALGKIENFPFANGIHIREFSLHGGASLSNGTVCLTGNDGFVIFETSQMPVNKHIPAVVLEDFQIDNRPVKVGDDTGILHCLLDDAKVIHLNYDQNNIAISYRALNFINSSMNRYAYRLEGYDKAWNEVGKRTTAYYTKLPAGRYVFHVKASNNDGIWNEEGRTLLIVISPPIWATWYAYLLYFILFVTIIWMIAYYYNTRRRLREELRAEQKEKLRQEEFHQARMRLFTNLAHELRTPLTLIITPFEDIIKQIGLGKELHDKLQIIYRNAQRLLLLVNQLMDLQRNQSGSMNLKVEKGDVAEFVREIYYAFKQIAQTNEVNFTLDCHPDSLVVWYDKTLLEKVVFNLLSNAFKYTPAGKSISMGLEYNQERGILFLRVEDSGCGIPYDERDKVFIPFYQVPETTGINITGTGIGLSLVYSIVQLYKGRIYIEDRQDGEEGTVFMVELPAASEHFTEDEKDFTFLETVGNTALLQPIPKVGVSDKLNTSQNKPLILIIEDDKEVRDYLRASLEEDYNILEANDGVKGYDCVLQDFPDLILSDIMMPKRNGLELCTMIKEDMRIGHIPIILMTARSMVVHIKEGFLAGADDYIVKPFSMELLRVRIHGLLQSRQQLKKLYGRRFSPEVLGTTMVSADERFSQKFFEAIEKYISDPELSIDTLCQEIGISRANLYRKIKAISDLSPTELIRNKRLEIAMKYLKETDMPISDIAATLGFGSHSYFSNSFKALYGMSPSEFVQTHVQSQE